MFKRMLAAVDESTRMQLVMRAGRLLTQRSDGALVVLRVRSATSERNQVTDSDVALAEQTGALRADGRPAHYLVHLGSAEKHIIQTAQQQHSTLIIIASRAIGPRTLRQRRMTARLAARAPAPVLVIPETSDDARSDDESAASLFGPDNAPILVALDGTPLAEQALPYAAELATLLNRPLVLVRVALPLQKPAELAAAWSYVEEARRRLRERISRDLHVDTQVVTGAPVNELLWAAEGRRAGAIVLAAHGHSDLSARHASQITLDTLQWADIPALVIPTPVLLADQAAQQPQQPQQQTDDNAHSVQP